jgi:hypothetical protein
MLASHSHIVSFPETRFFSRTLPINSVLRQLKLHGAGSRSVVQQYLEENGYQAVNPFQDMPSRRLLTHDKWCRILIDVIDQMIIRGTPEDINDNTIWGLEKSPRHLHYISSIESGGPGNKYLHLLRHGPDVVASMHLVTNRYPEQWSGRRSVSKCVRWWNHSMRASLKYRDSPNHLFVVYEQLLASPKKVLQAICRFLGLNYQEEMSSHFHQTADGLLNEDNKWHGRNEKRTLSKSNKLEKHFGTAAIRYIGRKTLNVDFNLFYH